MSKINKENYEAFLLDYFEGTLSPELQDELFLFAATHPELDIQLNITELPSLTQTHTSQAASFRPKNKLYKSKESLQDRFDELCFNFFEKTASDDEIQELNFLKHQFPEFNNEFLIFQRTILNPDESVNFQEKDLLKKEFHIAGSFDELAIKLIENTLNKDERVTLDALVSSNPALSRELNYYKASVLPKDEIIFEYKRELYRNKNNKGIIQLYTAIIAIAASLALVIGLFGILNLNNNSPKTALMFDNNVSNIPMTRKVIANVAIQNDSSDHRIENSPDKANQQSGTIDTNLKVEKSFAQQPDFFKLQAKKAIPIEQFELPSEFISLSPLELQQYNLLRNNAYANSSNLNRGYLTPGQFARKQITKLFKKQNIDIVTPLENLNNGNLSDLGMKSLEKVSRGKIYLEKDELAGKITGVHFFGLSYSRN